MWTSVEWGIAKGVSITSKISWQILKAECSSTNSKSMASGAERKESPTFLPLSRVNPSQNSALCQMTPWLRSESPFIDHDQSLRLLPAGVQVEATSQSSFTGLLQQCQSQDNQIMVQLPNLLFQLNLNQTQSLSMVLTSSSSKLRRSFPEGTCKYSLDLITSLL